MDLKLDHPTTDPRLPSFRHRALRDLHDDLQVAGDVWACLRGCKDKYLPSEPEEPLVSYRGRLARSVFTDFFRYSIEAIAGVLSKFSVVNAPGTFMAAMENIDLEGNDLITWLTNIDATTLRDGGTWLQVEMPPDEPGNRAQEIAAGRRPYLVRRARSLGVNWATVTENGITSLDWVMFLEVTEEPVTDGFGTELVTRYRQIGRGWQKVFTLQQDSAGKWHYDSAGPIPILGANGQPINVCPVVWFSAELADPGMGEMPFRTVAEANVEHFQRCSDLREKDHKINMPVPVVIGARVSPALTPAAQAAAAAGMAPSAAPWVIGPNTIIHLEEGGSFTFAEPSAASLSFSQAQIEAVEKRISRQTLGFLYGDSGAPKTATQSGMEGAQTESAILRMSRRKASAVQSLMQLWVLFTGETLAPTAGIAMDDTVFEPPLTGADVTQLQLLTGGLELLSQRSAVEILQRRRYNLATRTPEEELQRLADEVPPEPPEPGMNEPPLEDDQADAES